MKKSKVLVMTLCAVLLVATTVLGTMAYLTSEASVVNTFTVGKVEITLDEAKVNPDGTPVTPAARTDAGNVYHLIPGKTYTKDPTMTVVKGSEESYVRMMVTVTFTEALTDAQLATNLDSIFTGYDATKWSRHDKTVADNKMSITYEYRYNTTVNAKDATDNMPLEPLFTEIAIPIDVDNDDIAILGGMNITVVGHAIQAAGFDNADDAWTAFDGQVNP